MLYALAALAIIGAMFVLSVAWVVLEAFFCGGGGDE